MIELNEAGQKMQKPPKDYPFPWRLSFNNLKMLKIFIIHLSH
jgi:hypothetical protein